MENLGKVYTPFSSEKAHRFIGKEGYFGDLKCLINGQTKKSRLKKINNGDYPFVPEEGLSLYQFFQPIIEGEKKYRPYKNMDEAFTQLSDKWILLKSESDKLKITHLSPCGVRIKLCRYSFEELLKLFTFLDGTPCGVEI